MKFIRGDLFAEIADFCYTDMNNDEDYLKIPHTFSSEAIEAFTGIPLIYTAGTNISKVLPLLATLKKKIIFISHNSDKSITPDLYAQITPNIIRWFSPNIQVIGERIESVPLGIENLQRFEFHHIRKEEKMLQKIQEEKTLRNLVFMCHSTHQANIEDRLEAYKVLANKPYVTSIYRPNIFDFDNYIDNIYHHKFVICPEGNGIDCHRNWESLYMDTIPIMKRNINTTYYEDLPICFIENWNQVTEEFLNKEYDRIINTEWNLDKAYFEYWRDRIKSYSQNNL